MRSLTKAWWLLAVCGVLEAVIAIIYFIMENANPLTFHRWNVTVMLLGRLTLAAGVCLIAAGIWRSFKTKAWLLALNGLVLSALGTIYIFFVGSRISFRTIALLIILMAITAAIPELQTARIMWRYGAPGWLLALAGALSVGFALVFLVLGFGGLKVEPGSHRELLWLGFYFVFSAVCMLGFALRPNISRQAINYL
jgi:uncharacterized membrane protein HdeD (DUF308 family)